MPSHNKETQHNNLHKTLLKVIHTAPAGLRKAILEKADQALIYSICEICHNTVSGNAGLSNDQIKQLKKYRKDIERLASKGESWQSKKKALNKRGGAFLPILLSFLAPVLGSLIFGK